MTPFVNTDAKMPAEMLEALDLFECECVGKRVEEVTEDEVLTYLKNNFGEKLSAQFKRQYLY